MSVKPSRTRLPLLVGGPVHRVGCPAELGEAGGQRPPGLVELGARGVDLGEHGLLVDALLEVVVAVARGPGDEDGPVDLGVELDAPGRRGEPGDLVLAGGRGGERRRALGQLGDHVGVPLHAAARRGERPISGSSGRLGGPADVEQPDLLAGAGSARTRPPSATATSWWPRQIAQRRQRRPRPASRISSLTGPSQWQVASSLAPIDPPRTSSASYAARGRAPRRRPRAGRPELGAGVGQPGAEVRRRAGGLVLDDQDDGTGVPRAPT